MTCVLLAGRPLSLQRIGPIAISRSFHRQLLIHLLVLIVVEQQLLVLLVPAMTAAAGRLSGGGRAPETDSRLECPMMVLAGVQVGVLVVVRRLAVDVMMVGRMVEITRRLLGRLERTTTTTSRRGRRTFSHHRGWWRRRRWRRTESLLVAVVGGHVRYGIRAGRVGAVSDQWRRRLATTTTRWGA